jgi:type IV pilus assembly protein PilQ
VRLLVNSVGGVIPGEDRWAKVWRRLQLGVDVTDPEKPRAFVRWPTAPWAPRQLRDPEDQKVVRFVRPARPLYTGNLISLDFKDGDLGDIFLLFADITGLNVVVNPGVRGTVTFRATKRPWDDVLDRMMSANGLA